MLLLITVLQTFWVIRCVLHSGSDVQLQLAKTAENWDKPENKKKKKLEKEQT